MSMASTCTQGTSETMSSISLYVYIILRRYRSDLTSAAWRTGYQDNSSLQQFRSCFIHNCLMQVLPNDDPVGIATCWVLSF